MAAQTVAISGYQSLSQSFGGTFFELVTVENSRIEIWRNHCNEFGGTFLGHGVFAFAQKPFISIVSEISILQGIEIVITNM